MTARVAVRVKARARVRMRMLPDRGPFGLYGLVGPLLQTLAE